MAKVFLSHSSKDKESYVDIVASRLVKELGKDSVILDKFTFEEGRKTAEEIELNLEITDLFVLFISEHSLNSEWVKKEIFKAENLQKEEKLSQICPIIISPNISYDDSRIPEWMKENYNLQYISKPTKSASIIIQRMIEIAFEKHPRLKERQELFVGRNDQIQQFEERIDDFSKEYPKCIIISGLKSIGRRSLAKHCITKTNIKKSTYQFPVIPLNADESIEDFILKMCDLGIGKEINIKELTNKKMDEKIIEATNIICVLQEQKEIIFVEDNGCIINHDGDIAKWFLEILYAERMENKITICLISKFRLFNFKLRENGDRIFTIEVNELSQKERRGLLKRYLEFEKLDSQISKEDMSLISGLLAGYPEQIFYTVGLIREKGMKYVKLHTEEIVEFNNKKASFLLKDIEKEKEKLEFLAFLSSFDYISIKFVYEITGEEEKYSKYFNEFLLMALCEYVGIMKEYIRVNETIKDYVIRNNYEMSPKHKEELKKNVDKFLKNMNMEEYDIPEFLYSLKQALSQEETIDEKYLIPSIYLKTMNEFYNKRKNKEVVSFADKVLENEEYMDERIIFEIRYLLCSALAKLRSERFLEEVQKIQGADHDFLFGFYYRQMGKYDKALQKIESSMKKRTNFSKAKREKVQVYISMQEFQAARELAKENYYNYKDNPYHIQAYYACLIKAEKNKENKKILQELLSALENIKSDVAKEMYWRCKAQYEAFYNENEEEALMFINKAIELNPDIHYANVIKFDICDKFNRINDMKKILNVFKEKDKEKNKNHNIITCFESILLAKEGRENEAIEHFKKNIRNYTDEAKQKFESRLFKIKMEKENI